MYSKEYQKKIRRIIQPSSKGVQMRSNAVLQRKLQEVVNDVQLIIFLFTSSGNTDEDIKAINYSCFEEIQIIKDNKSVLIQGNINKDDLKNMDNTYIIGTKSRINSFYRSEHNYENEGHSESVYYDALHSKSPEIAFANKMYLRGYLMLTDGEVDSIGKDNLIEINSLEKYNGKKNKKDALTMRAKKWYMPKDSQWIPFKQYDTNAATENIEKWKKLTEIQSSIVAKREGTLALINSYNTLSKYNIDEFLKAKGIMTAEGMWTVKSRDSLLRRLYHKSISDSNLLPNISENISIHQNENNYRNMIELKNTFSEKNKWKCSTEEELGDAYKNMQEPRSNDEWLEILHWWERDCQFKEIQQRWEREANLHLDTTGFESKEHNTSLEITQNLRDQLEGNGFIDKSGKWLLNNIRELGDFYATKRGSNFEISWEDILRAWNNTHHTKVTYNLDNKFNLWSQGKTEWGVNSTSNSGSANETPFAGWSRFVYNTKGTDDLIKFKDIRDAEVPHYHPIQTEIYIVKKGTACMRHKNDIIKVTADEPLIVKPNEIHYIIAVTKDYEHLVIQSPSGFHHDKNKVTVNKPEYENDFNIATKIINNA